MFELAQQLIEEFLNGIKQDLLEYMQAENRNASGKSAASLTVTADGKKGTLSGAPYIQNVFRGRGPGGMPPISQLIDWCNARGLPRGIAWAVARRIAESGTKLHQEGRNVLNEVITEEKIETFKRQILKTYVYRIKSDIQSILATAA